MGCYLCKLCAVDVLQSVCWNYVWAIDKVCREGLLMWLFVCFLQPRYVVNQVTAGDYDCPRKVLKFMTDLHAAFRMLNLRNDFLRKKFDGSLLFFILLILYSPFPLWIILNLNVIVYELTSWVFSVAYQAWSMTYGELKKCTMMLRSEVWRLLVIQMAIKEL
jgi:hypothetical protein